MIFLIQIILIFISLILFIPTTFLLVECITALFPLSEEIVEARPSNIAVLVPAHNEANYIEDTLNSIAPQLNLIDSDSDKFISDRLIVIADNCTDNTAELAKKIDGVTVIERTNSHLRGKGYAIDFGLSYLKSAPPNIVIMVDGDCTVKKHTIDTIARLAQQSNRPIQANYLMDVPPSPSYKDIISSFALILKNSVRQKGLSKLKIPCLLAGSGMAFSWDMVNQVSFANSKTVDDMQLGLDLAIAGYPPLHCSSGKVRGRLMKDKFAKSQKSRWEHGHIETILTETPRLFQAAWRQKRLDLLGLALELCIPPLSLLIIGWFTCFSLSTLGIILNFSLLPLKMLTLQGVFIFIAIFLAWLKFARNEVQLKLLLTVPFYLVWKIPVYWSFLFKRQSIWTKTERDA